MPCVIGTNTFVIIVLNSCDKENFKFTRSMRSTPFPSRVRVPYENCTWKKIWITNFPWGCSHRQLPIVSYFIKFLDEGNGNYQSYTTFESTEEKIEHAIMKYEDKQNAHGMCTFSRNGAESFINLYLICIVLRFG